MSKPSRPTKTAKVVVELPEGLPEKDEDANEQTLPFLARAAAPEDVKESTKVVVIPEFSSRADEI